MHGKLGLGMFQRLVPRAGKRSRKEFLKARPEERTNVTQKTQRGAIAYAPRCVGICSTLRRHTQRTAFFPLLYSRTARSILSPPAQQHRKHVQRLLVAARREDERMRKQAFSPLSPPWSYSHPRMGGRLYASPPAVSYPLHPVPQPLRQTRYIGRQGKVYRPRWCRLWSAPR